MQGVEARKKQREEYLRALASKRTEPQAQAPPQPQHHHLQVPHQLLPHQLAPQQHPQQQLGVREQIYEERRLAFQQRAAGQEMRAEQSTPIPSMSPRVAYCSAPFEQPAPVSALQTSPYFSTPHHTQRQQPLPSPVHTQQHPQQLDMVQSADNWRTDQRHGQQRQPPFDQQQGYQQQQCAAPPGAGETGLITPGLAVDPNVAKEMKRQRQTELAQALQQQMETQPRHVHDTRPQQGAHPVTPGYGGPQSTQPVPRQQQQTVPGVLNGFPNHGQSAQEFGFGEERTAQPRQGHRLGGGISAFHAGDDSNAKRLAKQQYAIQLQQQIREKQQQQHQSTDVMYGGEAPAHQPTQPPAHLSMPAQAFQPMYEAATSPNRAGQQPSGEFVIGPLGLPVRKTYELGNRAMQKMAHQHGPEMPAASQPPQPRQFSIAGAEQFHAPHNIPIQYLPQHQTAHQQPAVPVSGSAFPIPSEVAQAGATSPPVVARGRQLAALRGGLSADQEQRAARAKAQQAAFLAQQIAEKDARKKKEKEEAAELERKEQLRIEREIAIEQERMKQEQERANAKQAAQAPEPQPSQSQLPPTATSVVSDSPSPVRQRQQQLLQQQDALGHRQPTPPFNIEERAQVVERPTLSIKTVDPPGRPAEQETAPATPRRRGTQGLWGPLSPARQGPSVQNQRRAPPSPPVPAQRHRQVQLWDDVPPVATQHPVQCSPVQSVRASPAESTQGHHEQQRSDGFAQQPAQLQHSSRPSSRVQVVDDDALKELHAELEDKDKQIARLKQELKAQLHAQQAASAKEIRDAELESQPLFSRTVSRQSMYEQQQHHHQQQQQSRQHFPQRAGRSDVSVPSRQAAVETQEMWARPVQVANTLQALDEQPMQEVVFFQPHVPPPKDDRRKAHGLDDDEIFRVDPTLEGSSRFVYPDGRSFAGDRNNSQSTARHHQLAAPQHAQASTRSAQMFQSLRNIGALDSARGGSAAGHDLSPCSRVSTPPLSACTDNFDLSKHYNRSQQQWALIAGMEHPDDVLRKWDQLRSLQTRGTDEEVSLYSPRPSSRSSTIAGRPLSGRLMSSGRNVMTSHSRGSLHSVNYSDTMSEANFGY